MQTLFGLGNASRPVCHMSYQVKKNSLAFVTLLDSEDVWSCNHYICHMLAAIPLLLPGGPLPPRYHEGSLHPAHLPGILLACNVKLLHKPNSLLCNE